MTLEYFVQMVPIWITAGQMVAWLAQAAWRARAYGLLIDIALGVVGAIAVGVVAGATAGSEPGMLAMFVIGAAGATALIAAQRRLWRPAHIELRPAAAGTVTAPAKRRVS